MAIAAVSAAPPKQEIPILSQTQEINHDGSYKYAYATGNGISAQEQGIGGQHAQGGAQWIAPDGSQVYFSYLADANGYQPEGSHIPTPPPVPKQILKALEWIKAHPSKESDGRF